MSRILFTFTLIIVFLLILAGGQKVQADKQTALTNWCPQRNVNWVTRDHNGFLYCLDKEAHSITGTGW